MRSYKLIYVTTAYAGFIQDFEQQEADKIKSLSYDELMELWYTYGYGFANYFTKYLNPLGHIGDQIYMNVPSLQYKWAEENNLQVDDKHWQEQILMAQVKKMRPDIFYAANLYLIGPNLREQIRNSVDYDLKIFGWRLAPTPNPAEFADLDMICTGNLVWRDNFSKFVKKAAFIPLGFEASLTRLSSKNKQYGFTFAGSAGKRKGSHALRYKILEKLMKETPLELWASPPPNPQNKWLNALVYQVDGLLKKIGVSDGILRKIPYLRRGVDWDIHPNTPHLTEQYPQRVHQPVFGLDYFRLLGNTKISLNTHINVTQVMGGNMRMYEATGMGSCLLTDWMPRVHELYEPDTEIVTYKSPEEAVEKYNYLITHEEERKKIAKAGQERTLKDYSFQKCVEKLNHIINDEILTD